MVDVLQLPISCIPGCLSQNEPMPEFPTQKSNSQALCKKVRFVVGLLVLTSRYRKVWLNKSLGIHVAMWPCQPLSAPGQRLRWSVAVNGWLVTVSYSASHEAKSEVKISQIVECQALGDK